MPLEDVQKHPWIIKHCKKRGFAGSGDSKVTKRKSVVESGK